MSTEKCVYISAILFIFAFAQDLHVTLARKPIAGQNHGRLAKTSSN